MAKPSLTKQISEVLGTDDKREQLGRIEGLVQKEGAPVAAITVLFAAGEVDIAVSSKFRLGASDVKGILALAIDNITEQVVRAELEAEAIGTEEVGPQTGDTMANGDMTP